MPVAKISAACCSYEHPLDGRGSVYFFGGRGRRAVPEQGFSGWQKSLIKIPVSLSLAACAEENVVEQEELW